MYEIFGFELTLGWYIILFVICQLINVALNTIKTIIMYRENKISSSIINAITYGFYAIIVVMTASALPLWITIIITALTNLIGVYGSMWLLDKFKKDKLWEITATISKTKEYEENEILYLETSFLTENISYNCMKTNKENEYVFHIYSKSKKESEYVKDRLQFVNAKYIVHEEKIKL